MEQIIRKINRLFHGSKRQMLTAGAALFIVYVLLLAGIFSYFHSEDAVSNRLNAKNGSVLIQEPAWDSTGREKAKVSEPGMTIEKDPSGYNNGQVDLYIRLKMTVELGDYTAKNDVYAQNFPDDPERRRNAILDAVRLGNGTAFLQNGRTETANTKFIMKTDSQDSSVFYFYYTGGDSSQLLKAVKPEESTEALFDHLKIPVFKPDYFGVFDQPYSITLTAEGIPAAKYPDGLTAGDAHENDEFRQ